MKYTLLGRKEPCLSVAVPFIVRIAFLMTLVMVYLYFPLTAKDKRTLGQAISHDKWEPKSHHRLCGEHFIGGSPSKDPNSVHYIPTIFKDRKRRCNAVQKDEERCLQAVKREKVMKESAEVHECVQTLLDVSANTSLFSTD